MALTWKIFYTSIFTISDFRTQTQRERERERERERDELAVPSSLDHCPKPRRAVELALARSSCKIALGRSSRRDRTVRSSRRPLDQTLFVSILASPEACPRWTGLVTHDPPMTDLSLSRSTSPFPSICDHSLFLLPLSV